MLSKFILLLTIPILVLSNHLSAQDYNINKVFKTYFPVNPYKYRFTTFYEKLNADPAVVNKSIQKRTDSTLFSFKGAMNSFKFGDFVFTDAEIRLEEIPLKIPGYNIIDTVLQYQLICFCTGGKTGIEIAKSAFKYFDENLLMPSSKVKTKVEEGRLTGLMRDYSYPGLPLSPVSAGWTELYDDKSCFKIIARMKLHQNFLDVYQDSDIKPGATKQSD